LIVRNAIGVRHGSPTRTWNRLLADERSLGLDKLATSKFAPDLAGDLLSDLRRFAAAAEAENLHRTGGAPDPLVQLPGADGPSVATDGTP
jgi:hypothetical protein